MKLCLLFVVFVVGAQGQFLFKGGSCANRCFTRNDYAQTCQCDSDCETIGNCCSDFWTRCRGSEYGLVVTPKELNTFAQSIWDNDVSRIDPSLYTLSYQGQRISPDFTDGSPDRFIQPVDTQLDGILSSSNSTYATFIKLLDNYEVNVQHDEHRPLHEIREEENFWDTIIQSQVMQLTFQFLVNNGFIKSDMHAFRTVINELWFELYPKHQAAAKSDSGFEHIMIGEKTVHHQHTQQNKPPPSAASATGYSSTRKRRLGIWITTVMSSIPRTLMSWTLSSTGRVLLLKGKRSLSEQALSLI
ncbi:uridylate-specific endoribonuclease-like [Haliotis rubra]|uniref:uridylate-specific endoribonuclease-like n=1 Tax=Haliotis rubra TaxID=36100 RepID=UPI001EE59861|nr:uridylate-specific endoribonuclease-like [Haliotis rubra]